MAKERILQNAVSNEVLRRILRESINRYRNELMDDEERRMKKEWEILKKEVHARDRYRCRICDRNDLPLHLHHRTYVDYAEESLESLLTLCEECHFLFHAHSKVS